MCPCVEISKLPVYTNPVEHQWFDAGGEFEILRSIIQRLAATFAETKYILMKRREPAGVFERLHVCRAYFHLVASMQPNIRSQN
jgi:hypothetical protein